MVKNWRPVVIPEELYQTCKNYYEENKEDLKLREGIRSLTAFINFCIREYLKEIGVIQKRGIP